MVQLAGPEQDCFCTFNALTAPLRIGKVDPPVRILGFDFYEVTCDGRSHVPFFGGEVDGNAHPENPTAGLVPWLDLLKSQRSIVEHSQFKIAARNKDMPLPIGVQGIGAS